MSGHINYVNRFVWSFGIEFFNFQLWSYQVILFTQVLAVSYTSFTSQPCCTWDRYSYVFGISRFSVTSKQKYVLVNKHAEGEVVGIKLIQKILDVTVNERIKNKLLLAALPEPHRCIYF